MSSDPNASPPLQSSPLAAVATLHEAVAAQVAQVVVGRDEMVRLAMIAALSNGHVLIEDVPGTGKTTFARAFAQALGLAFSRVQFTPDLVPSDVVGVNLYNSRDGNFEFREGPIFTEVLLADEINRATPRTQSALLEAMQESQVTVDGKTYPLTPPFLVLATQNSVEMEGTFRLPEAQLDRFALSISLGYPSPEDELAMLARFEASGAGARELGAVATREALLGAQQALDEVKLTTQMREYIMHLAQWSRAHAEVRLGASPRASLTLQRAAQASAALDGRDFVLPDDVQAMTLPVLRHRIVVDNTAALRGVSGEDVARQALQNVAVPLGEARR